MRAARRSVLAVLTLLLALTAAGCDSSPARTTRHVTPHEQQPTAPAARPKPRPNIVFVLTDDLAWNLVQYMPHVQELQSRGMTFSRYFVTDSLCCPSRSSIFSGRYPHNTKIFTNKVPDGGFDAFHARGEEASTWATDLQGAGYRTAMMGKYLNGYMPG